MALLEILRGSSEKFDTDLSKSNVSPTFKDGRWYFLPDQKMFYIDYQQGNSLHRIPLNAHEAEKILGYEIVDEALNSNAKEIPTSNLIYKIIGDIDLSTNTIKSYIDTNFLAKDDELITLADIEAICTATPID